MTPTPKEKADELLSKYLKSASCYIDSYDAFKFSIITVDEMLKINNPTLVVFKNGDNLEAMTHEQYWQQVKNELYK